MARFLLVWVVLFFARPAGAAELLDHALEAPLGTSALYIVDDEGLHQITQHALVRDMAVARGRPQVRDVRRFFLVEPVTNRTAVREWLLREMVPEVERISVALVDAEGAATILYSDVHMARRTGQIPTFGHQIPLNLEPGATYTLVVLIENPRGPWAGPDRLELVSQPEFARAATLQSTIVLLCLGAMLATALSSLALGLRTRDGALIWYGLFAVSGLGMWGTYYGVLAILLGPALSWTDLRFTSAFAVVSTFSMFVERFLEPRRIASALSRALLWVAGTGAALMVLTPFVDDQLTYNLYSWLVLGMSATVGTAAAFSWGRAGAAERIFVLAWSLTLLSGTLYAIEALRLVKFPFPVALLTFVSMTFSMVVMSMAQAERLRAMQERRHEAEAMARTDRLTGLRNRSALDDDLPRLAARHARRSQKDLVVLFADVDGLKKLNDSEGHDAGDRLLRDFAQLLREEFRTVDWIYRIGGDEFVVLVPGARSTAFRALEQRFDSIRGRLDEMTRGASGVSVGMAWLAETQGDSEAALLLADKRMYEDKQRRKAAPGHHASADLGASGIDAMGLPPVRPPDLRSPPDSTARRPSE